MPMNIDEAIRVTKQHLESREIELDGERWDFTFCVRRVVPHGEGIKVVYALEDDCYDEDDPDQVSELTHRILTKAIDDLRATHPELGTLSIAIESFKN